MSSPKVPGICDEVLLSPETIDARVRELGAWLASAYADKDVRLITVLRGGLFFMADLARAIDLPLSMDFYGLAPYRPGRGGVAAITKDLADDIRGANVILVEDIVDTGLTLSYVLRLLKAHQPESLEICALLDKPARRIAPVEVAYTGFQMPDRFLVGYGLDLAGRYRNLPFIATVREDVLPS